MDRPRPSGRFPRRRGPAADMVVVTTTQKNGSSGKKYINWYGKRRSASPVVCRILKYGGFRMYNTGDGSVCCRTGDGSKPLKK